VTYVRRASPLHAAHVFYDRTLKNQSDRQSPFSLWDWRQYHARGLPDLHVLQRVLEGLLVAAAVAFVFVPRRKSPLQLAALTVVLLWPSLPSLEVLTDYRPKIPLRVYSAEGELIGEYGDLDSLLARAGEIKQEKRRQVLIDYADQIRLSRELVRLDCETPLPEPLDELKARTFLLSVAFASRDHPEVPPEGRGLDLIDASVAPRQARWLVRAADRPNGGLVFDSWHFFRGEPQFDVLETIPGDRIFQIQLDDAPAKPEGPLRQETQHRLLPGDGELDLVTAIRTLHRIGALHWVGPEVISPQLAALPVLDAATLALDRTRASLAAALATPGQSAH